MAWADFNLPGCATGGDDPNVAKFLEYPIIVGGQPWQGGDVVQGNDRVIFQDIDSSTAAFCGIVRHPGKDGVNNHFQMCNDPVGSSAVAPYAQGTCSLHLTQWDYEFETSTSNTRYDVEVKIFDNSKTQIGFQSRTACGASDPVYVSSALEDDLTVIAESEHDYIAFSLPEQSWPSDGRFGTTDAHNPCSVGHWDGSDYPPHNGSNRISHVDLDVEDEEDIGNVPNSDERNNSHLGFSPEDMESRLSEILRVAHPGDCVLLLDEAEIFIAQRNQGDLKRNAMVSVFLRILEWYHGVLFLTTNRPGILDEAVKSRVRLSLRYDYLSHTRMENIFQINIDRLRKVEGQRSLAAKERNTTYRKLNIDDDSVPRFAQEHYDQNTNDIGRWNGRQIRNAFLIASSLAHFDGDKKSPEVQKQLNSTHFLEVERTSKLFDEYRQSVWMKNDRELEMYRTFRNDDFKSPSPLRNETRSASIASPSIALDGQQVWPNSQTIYNSAYGAVNSAGIQQPAPLFQKPSYHAQGGMVQGQANPGPFQTQSIQPMGPAQQMQPNMPNVSFQMHPSQSMGSVQHL
ncbi:MAG: hypothetical protein M1821_004455 [Bathelium mastoideum]|nr:MAG: hypothetical protein M1821_004455 [Bathelium mastoideum]